LYSIYNIFTSFALKPIDYLKSAREMNMYKVHYRLLMQKLAITITLAVIALALGTTTTTTTMQIQPAYSQPSHCLSNERGLRCITPGKDASTFACFPSGCTDPVPLDPQQAGQGIGSCHVGSARGAGECIVTKTPLPPSPPPP
jgi:hypothetical protein